MIRRPGSAREGGFADLTADLTPMLDVLFILLIFFVLTANSAQLALDVTLPQADRAAGQAVETDNRITVSVLSGEAGWRVDGATFGDWSAAQDAIRAAHSARPDAQFVIAGDRSATLQNFVQTLGFLRSLGIAQTDIVMEPQ